MALVALSLSACDDQPGSSTTTDSTDGTSTDPTSANSTTAPTGPSGPSSTVTPTGATGSTVSPSGGTGGSTGGAGVTPSVQPSSPTNTDPTSPASSEPGDSSGATGSDATDADASTTGSDTTGGELSTTSSEDGGSPDTSDDTSEPPPPCVPDGRAHNPLVTHIFTADPNAVVYGDRIYLYVSHDVDGQDGYEMVDYRGFSSDDMVNWQDHGILIHTDSLPWAENLYAPGACSKNGKYYLYMPNGGTSIGVAVADDPGGPFVDPIGDALITKSFPNANVDWLFDPACFVDDDGQGYLYFGGGQNGADNARVIRLGDDMISLADPSATTIPTEAFFEAAFVHKHEGTYYFSYSSDFSADHGAAIEYQTSDNPMTGFTHKGKILPNSALNNNDNNHASIVDFNGKLYLFYHARKLQQELGVNKVNNRSVAVQEVAYGPDNTINPITMSTEDFTVAQVKCLDGFSEVQAETLAAEQGIEVEGVAGETVRVAEISNGDWVGYSQVDFRTGATSLVLQVASAQGGGTIDISLDDCITGDPGTSIGSCEVPSTGGADTFEALSCEINAPAGPHDLCLTFSGSPAFEIDSWHLE